MLTDRDKALIEACAVAVEYAANFHWQDEPFSIRAAFAQAVRNTPLPTLPAAEGWVSVETRKPDTSKHQVSEQVLVTDGRTRSIGYYTTHQGWRGHNLFDYVTHWSPLPALPAPPAAGDEHG